MTFLKLKEKLKDYPLFKINDVFKWFPSQNGNTLKVQLSMWAAKGYLERIKRGVYKFADYQVKDVFILADFLALSYISAETALNYHGIIPDVPFAVVSVTPTKTHIVKTEKYGSFIYYKIKQELFFDYKIVKSDPIYSYKIATPEKAVFDWIYLRSFQKDFNPRTYLSEARLNFGRQFKWTELKRWQKLIPANNRKFHLAWGNLLQKYAK